jgi:hypothetical protein
LRQQLAALQTQVDQLTATVAHLQEQLAPAHKDVFGVIHRRDELPARAIQTHWAAARAAVLRQAITEVRPTRQSQNMAKRLAQHGAASFAFVTTPGIEPTTNVAEPAIRFVVMDRPISQGTRGEAGRRRCDWIWTVVATCAQQGRSVFAYLAAVVPAAFEGAAVPSLFPAVK